MSDSNSKQRALKWRNEHKDAAVEYSRKYRAAHPDKVKQQSRKWYEVNKAHVIEYQRQYRAKKREEQPSVNRLSEECIEVEGGRDSLTLVRPPSKPPG